MKKSLIIMLLIIYPSVAHSAIQLTDEQYENIDIIHSELKKADAGYIGLNGPKEAIEIIGGISEKDALRIIGKINLEKEKKDLPRNKKKEALKEKFKSLGFDDEMLEQIGLKK